MPYNFAANSFHTKKLCSSEVRFFTQIGLFAFFRPPLGDLGATYDDHLRYLTCTTKHCALPNCTTRRSYNANA